jgi:hypothetical protein
MDGALEKYPEREYSVSATRSQRFHSRSGTSSHSSFSPWEIIAVLNCESRIQGRKMT